MPLGGRIRLEPALALIVRLLRGRTVEGEPYVIGEREITPVVRVRGLGLPGGRWQFRLIQPVAVVESTGGEVHRVRVRGGGLPGRALAVGLLAPVLVYLVARTLLVRRS